MRHMKISNLYPVYSNQEAEDSKPSQLALARVHILNPYLVLSLYKATTPSLPNIRKFTLPCFRGHF